MIQLAAVGLIIYNNHKVTILLNNGVRGDISATFGIAD
jgi:hypothetical protein